MNNSKIAIVLSAFSAVSARTLPALHEVNVAVWADVETELNINEDAGMDTASAQYGHGDLVAQGSATGFRDQGGPKLTAPKLFAQFYGNGSWNTANTALFETFFAGIGAHSYLGSSRAGGAGTVSYVKGTNRKIINGGSSTRDLDTQSEIFAIAASQVGAYGESLSSQNHYAFIPDQYKSNNLRNDRRSAFAKEWCGYHSAQTKNNVDYSFSVNGYASGSACAWFTATFPDGVVRSAVNDDQVDYVINVLAHEIQESITDPFYFNKGWYDTTSNIPENGDKCNGWLGGINVDGNIYYNLTIGSTRFAVQTHLDHTNNTCPHVTWV